MSKKRWYRITLLAVAIMLYITANILDYSHTVGGIANGVSAEGNPLAQKFIEIFGLKRGMEIFKTLTVGFVISCAMVLEIKYCKKKRILAPSTLLCWLLCFGALLKLLAVWMWLRLGS